MLIVGKFLRFKMKWMVTFNASQQLIVANVENCWRWKIKLRITWDASTSIFYCVEVPGSSCRHFILKNSKNSVDGGVIGPQPGKISTMILMMTMMQMMIINLNLLISRKFMPSITLLVRKFCSRSSYWFHSCGGNEPGHTHDKQKNKQTFHTNVPRIQVASK